jgi:hypothetical protein
MSRLSVFCSVNYVFEAIYFFQIVFFLKQSCQFEVQFVVLLVEFDSSRTQFYTTVQVAQWVLLRVIQLCLCMAIPKAQIVVQVFVAFGHKGFRIAFVVYDGQVFFPFSGLRKSSTNRAGFYFSI